MEALIAFLGPDRALAFAMLAIGPALGALAMLRLRQLPEAARMSSGNR